MFRIAFSLVAPLLRLTSAPNDDGNPMGKSPCRFLQGADQTGGRPYRREEP